MIIHPIIQTLNLNLSYKNITKLLMNEPTKSQFKADNNEI